MGPSSTGEGPNKGSRKAPQRPLGLSLWKLSSNLLRFSFLLIFTVKFPTLSAMADLYPSIILGCNFLS